MRAKSLWSLAGLALCYAATLWWIHRVVHNPLNVDYFTRYVSLQCSAQHTDRVERPRSREVLAALEKDLKRCQGIAVQVDGIWGGLLWRPSVRLKVLFDDGTSTQLKYYSVDVSPIIGTASIRYELTPTLYYLNP